MPLEGHWQRQHTPLRRVARTEVGVVAIVASLLAVCVATVTGLSLAGAGSSKHAAGCVDATAATSTGGARIQACGGAARHWCSLEAGRTTPLARALQPQCRRAGYSRPGS